MCVYIYMYVLRFELSISEKKLIPNLCLQPNRLALASCRRNSKKKWFVSVQKVEWKSVESCVQISACPFSLTTNSHECEANYLQVSLWCSSQGLGLCYCFGNETPIACKLILTSNFSSLLRWILTCYWNMLLKEIIHVIVISIINSYILLIHIHLLKYVYF